MILPIILIAIVIIALAVYFWYITIPLIVIIVVIWHHYTKDSDEKHDNDYESRRSQSNSYHYTKDSDEKHDNDYESRRSQSNSYHYSYDYHKNSNSQSDWSNYKRFHKEFHSRYQSHNSSKNRKQSTRTARINARLEKFKITSNDAEIIFGKTWKSKLGKPEWSFYFVIKELEIDVIFDYKNKFRNKVGHLYSKVLEIIQIVIDENPEMQQEFEKNFKDFKEKYGWGGFWDGFDDQNKHEHSQNDDFSEVNSEDIAAAYEILGLNQDCTKEQIKSKYRELVLQHHPDKNKSHDTTAKMAEINRAYEMIMGAMA